MNVCGPAGRISQKPGKNPHWPSESSQLYSVHPAGGGGNPHDVDIAVFIIIDEGSCKSDTTNIAKG